MGPGFPWLEFQAASRGAKIVAGSILRRHPQDNPEQAFFVKASRIFVKGFRFANKGRMARKIPVEGMEPIVGVDVVDYDSPARSQHRQRVGACEAQVPFAM